LSRLATHFSIFYRTFSRREAVFHAKETGTNPEEVGITSELRPQLTTIPHKCQRNWPIPNDSREKTEIVHNSPQMPANPKENGRTIEDSSPAIRLVNVAFELT
jgi:hypothetical protein